MDQDNRSHEEATEGKNTVALADAGEAGVVGQRLVKIVSEVPAQREAVGYDAHELALGEQVLKEHHKLELEEDYRVYQRTARTGVQGAH